MDPWSFVGDNPEAICLLHGSHGHVSSSLTPVKASVAVGCWESVGSVLLLYAGP